MRIIDIPQRSQEWIDLRKECIGASEAPIILGISPYRTPLQLWQEKLDLINPQATNNAMRLGIDKEEEARQMFIYKTGIEVFPCVAKHDTIPFMMASFDGVSIDQETAVEIKCNGYKNHSLAIQGKIPDHHYAQVQHQLCVLNLDFMYLFSYDGTLGISIKIDRDQKFIDDLLIAEANFFRCLNELEQPDSKENRFIDMTEDLDFKKDVEMFLRYDEELKRIQELEKIYRKRLIEKSNGNNIQGHGIKISKVMKKGSVDYDKIVQLKDVDLDKYRKETTETYRICKF